MSFLKHQFGYNELQNRVAEEFQPFVVRSGRTTMRQRLPQQMLVRKFIRQ